MATRIHPRITPAEPASPRLEPNAEMLLAPPPNLSKRLTAAVHRSLPGWTVQVLVKRWAEDRVRVVITGQRDADAIAPPAPPTGSAEAEKLSNRVARVLERSMEEERQGIDCAVTYEYTSRSPIEFKLVLQGISIGIPHDPPTCVDGEVVFPGDARLVNQRRVTVTNESEVDRWVFLHWPIEGSTTPPSPPAPLGQTLVIQASFDNGTWLPSNATPPINPPALIHASQPTIPYDKKTFAYLVSSGGGSLTWSVNVQLANWWVWW